MKLFAGVIAAFLLFGAGSASAEVIDRVMAVVSGQIVTKSDVDAAAAFGMAASLDGLVDRVLMLNEVRRVAPPDPPDAAIDERLAGMAARFESPAAFARALDVCGIDESVLRVYASDDLRLAAYLDERFSAASQPTDAEVRQYLNDHAGMSLDTGRQQLAAERRQALIAAWIAELRRRADITILEG